MPDAQGYLLPSERRILLRRYAPVLVLFPELPDQAPYPDDGDAIYTMRGSYHPRSVEFFLREARVCYSRSLLLRHPTLWFKPYSPVEEVKQAEQAVTAQGVEQALERLNGNYRSNPDYAGLDEAGVRAVLRYHLVQQRLRRRVQGFDLPLDRGRNIAQWKAYFAEQAEADPVTRRSVVYGRLIQGQEALAGDLTSTERLLQADLIAGPYDVSRARVALQYWFQYYYNDWANRHEGDWETITLLIEIRPETIQQARELNEKELLHGVTVHDAGYASHEDGYRRLWNDVQRTAEDHPIVYVARGSQASYFAWTLEGYPASARIGLVEQAVTLPGRLARGQRFLGRRWDALYSARFTGRDPKNTDWVAADPLPEDRLDPASVSPMDAAVPERCRGVRRRPDFGPGAGQDEATYHLETDNLFWLEMVQEYGVRWGEDSLLPGGKGPKGIGNTERNTDRREILQLGRLETMIARALEALSGIRANTEHAIPELAPALRPLRPRNLRGGNAFPRSVRPDVYTMWAWILKMHPEAWPGGPGLWLGLVFRQILYPGLLQFIRKQPEPEPLLKKDDPMYYLKALLAEVRRVRYERQLDGSIWDNPFAWVRHACNADTFYYGKTHTQAVPISEILAQLDCVDMEMTME